jgi:hypothetical protein
VAIFIPRIGQRFLYTLPDTPACRRLLVTGLQLLVAVLPDNRAQVFTPSGTPLSPLLSWADVGIRVLPGGDPFYEEN